MVLSRTSFFFILLVAVLAPFLVPKISWLAHSQKANGTMRFVGKAYTGQLIHFYSVISFPVAKDTFWFNSNDNTIYEPGDLVPVRYQTAEPTDAKVNIFSNLWSDTVIYGSAPLLILFLVFFHPKGIPKHIKIRLSKRKPIISAA